MWKQRLIATALVAGLGLPSLALAEKVEGEVRAVREGNSVIVMNERRVYYADEPIVLGQNGLKTKVSQDLVGKIVAIELDQDGKATSVAVLRD